MSGRGGALAGWPATHWANLAIANVVAQPEEPIQKSPRAQGTRSIRAATLLHVPLTLAPSTGTHTDANLWNAEGRPSSGPREPQQESPPRLETLALVDCGAPVSLVHPQKVQELGAQGAVQPAPLALGTWAENTPRVEVEGMLTLTVTVQKSDGTGARSVTHPFLVARCHEQVIVGLDLFPGLGFFLGGLPRGFPGARPGETAAQEAAMSEAPFHEHRKVWDTEDQVTGDELV